MQRLKHYSQLIRLDKPIGTLLLMWPMLIALWVAGQGMPSFKNIFIFMSGCFLMRSAGCAINDFADRKIDGLVSRTQNRPLARGVIQPIEAIGVFLGCVILAFCLVWQTNWLTLQWSILAVVLAFVYPFVKRFSYYPQFVLGAAYACAVPMAFAAQMNSVPAFASLLYIATLLWAVAYDTQYAMVDREDDLKANVKSTAILFGTWDRVLIFIAHILMLIFLVFFGYYAHLGFVYYSSIGLALGLVIYQQKLIYHRSVQDCFKAFLNNNKMGMILFVGVCFSYLLSMI